MSYIEGVPGTCRDNPGADPASLVTSPTRARCDVMRDAR